MRQLEVDQLTLRYGTTLVQQNLSFGVERGSIFIIMGPSGCGKSTVMRCLSGLLAPAAGEVRLAGDSLWGVSPTQRTALMRRQGVMYQSGALWSGMTLADNVALPLTQYSALSPRQIRELAECKLALVGLGGFGDYYPSEISGGMRKRVGVARAMALDPDVLFFDEPSAGLDPLSARRLDELIVQLRDSLNTTMILVTHELDSILAIGDDSVFLDPQQKTMLATGSPRWLRDHAAVPLVRAFLRRGEP